ncbi:MAG: HAD family hydrolase [Desulfuromonadales bacterium]|nr:HAD family hydrolase [Desulfuromonadales bacterium]
MNNVRGIVFDCDGVLFESQQANLAYYNTILEHFSEEPVEAHDHDRAHLCHTAASPEVFLQLLGEQRLDEALTLAAKLDYRQFIPYMNPAPGLTQALSALSARFPLAIATNRGYSMPQILQHFELEDFFSTVVTSKDVARPKPHPDMLLEAAKRLDLPVESLLFIGDSELDQAAAKQAGMRFAVYRGRMEADLVLDHHQELVEMLKQAQ